MCIKVSAYFWKEVSQEEREDIQDETERILSLFREKTDTPGKFEILNARPPGLEVSFRDQGGDTPPANQRKSYLIVSGGSAHLRVLVHMLAMVFWEDDVLVGTMDNS